LVNIFHRRVATTTHAHRHNLTNTEWGRGKIAQGRNFNLQRHSAFETSEQFTGQDNVTSLSLPCTLNITVGMVVIHEKLEE